MAEAKIEFAVGSISFAGEGEKDWVDAQAEKFLNHLPELIKVAPQQQSTSSPPASGNGTGTLSTQNHSLGTFLKEKNVGDNQVAKFLATAFCFRGAAKRD